MRDESLPEPVKASVGWAGGGFELDTDALYAGMAWRRVVAFLIDMAIVAVMLSALWLAAFLTMGALSGLLALTPLVPVAYHTLTIGGRNSATIGMQFMGIEVRSVTGGRPGLLQAFAMTALFYLGIALTSLLILVVALFNDRRRCAHDFLSGTVVVNADADL